MKNDDFDWDKHWEDQAKIEARDKRVGRTGGIILLLAFLLFVMCDSLPDSHLEQPTCEPVFAC